MKKRIKRRREGKLIDFKKREKKNERTRIF
jgi:hypothetical protein